MGGWGISRLIFLKSTLYFTTFILMKKNGFTFLAIPLLYTSLVFFLVSIASHPNINLPMLLGKSTDGSFPLWSTLIFFPYLLFVRIFSKLRRLLSREEPYHEICEGVYVGGWPSSFDNFPPNNNNNNNMSVAIIDCTCEFPRVSHFDKNPYFCVPTWDTRSPQPSEIESAVKWACRKRSLGVPVFIHCAYGHGRSVAVTCALLVALEVVDNWKEAEKLIKKKRPYINMNSLHRQALEEWAKHRLSPIKRKTDLSSIMSNSLAS